MHVSKYRWYLIDIDDDDDDNDDNNDDNDDDDEIRAYVEDEVLSTSCSCYSSDQHWDWNTEFEVKNAITKSKIVYF